MNTLLLLLFIHLCSFHNVWKSVGILVVNSSHSQHTNQALDRRGSNKNEKAHQNTESDAAGGHQRKDFIYDNSGIDGLGDMIASLNNYNHKPSRDYGTYPLDTDDISDRDRKSYPPIRNTFTFDHNGKSNQRGTRLDQDIMHLSSNERRHMDNNITDYIFDDVSSDSDNDSSFNVGAVSNRDINNYVDVYNTPCPDTCLCVDGTQLLCVGKNLSSVPRGISPLTTSIDLSMNSIHTIPDDSLAHLHSLQELRCVGNNLTDLPPRLFKHNKFLRLLHFQGNLFQKVPAKAFQNLRYLLELHLDANEITAIPKNAFTGLSNLKHLWLDDNKLDHVPTKTFRSLTAIEALTLIKNKITHIQDYAFQNNTKLIQLRLSNNAIHTIADQAFYGLTKLRFLTLQQNRLTAVPSAFSHLVSLEELNLDDNLLTQILDKSFLMKNKLTTLHFNNNPITFVADGAFKNLPSLQGLKLSEVYDMVSFPDLRGTRNLALLQLDRANIKSIPENLCSSLTKLKNFDMHHNKIETLPKMSQCKYLTILNMASNELTSIEGQLFYGMGSLKDLTLSLNFIHSITENTFVGLSALEYLNLAQNQIREIHSNAFLPLKSLKDLNLGYNRIHHLPTAGLISLEALKVFHNPDLREFPPKEQFPNVNNFVLSYAYHCCDFIQSRPEEPADTREDFLFLDTANALPGHMNFSSQMIDFFNNITLDTDHWESISQDNIDLSKYHADTAGNHYLEDYQSQSFNQHNYVIAKAAISCKPRPGPFMPCDDLFGWWSLRCGVWFVFMLALLGNGVVFFVSVTSKSKMDVTRFLICNLALADFFMGIYLGILAIMDASTLGHFKKYAIQWQMSAGCLVAGTLGVLSSELSVFTLTVITLERFYAITHAMQLNKRLSLKHAGFIMLCGWIWSFGLAILPLFGISDYRKFAVCLPFEIESVISKSYVCFLMVFNGISFFIILSCYLIMYISIRHSQSWNSNDTRVAKRMALLVFTDLLCWAPIATLSLAAAFGKNLIHLNEAKVLTIFILPLNSCANPFLYAFFTKQFKKDCVLLCRRLEDSFLAKHFSQAAQRHISLSWKYHHHHPSALNSLVGESKTNNSHNNSSGSNSFGLLNYNSEVSSGTSKTACPEAVKFDQHITESKTYSTTNGDGIGNSKVYYKYTPCPSSGKEDDTKNMKNTFTDMPNGDEDYYVQVTLDQTEPERRWSATDGRFVETGVSDDYEHFIFSAGENRSESTVVKAYTHRQFTREVIRTGEQAARVGEHLRKNTSQQNPTTALMDSSHYRENEVYINIKKFNHMSHPHKWPVNALKKTHKDIKIKNSNNEVFPQEKAMQ
ncbi:hypothetical protein BsWGS_18807 [Bradybaena similaris]